MGNRLSSTIWSCDIYLCYNDRGTNVGDFSSQHFCLPFDPSTSLRAGRLRMYGSDGGASDANTEQPTTKHCPTSAIQAARVDTTPARCLRLFRQIALARMVGISAPPR